MERTALVVGVTGMAGYNTAEALVRGVEIINDEIVCVACRLDQECTARLRKPISQCDKSAIGHITNPGGLAFSNFIGHNTQSFARAITGPELAFGKLE